MFVSFSNSLTKMGNFRIGAGFRITKKNMWYGLFIVFFMSMLKLTWNLLILVGWGTYGMMYCLYKFYYFLIAYPIKAFVKAYKKSKNENMDL